MHEGAFVAPTATQLDIIGIREATFTWDPDSETPGTPGSRRRNFKLRIDGEVAFKRGHINLIVGPTGCGKTSLLMALLGEMHYLPMGPNSYVSLPRSGGIAYHAQESWVLNETIRVGPCMTCYSFNILKPDVSRTTFSSALHSIGSDMTKVRRRSPSRRCRSSCYYK